MLVWNGNNFTVFARERFIFVNLNIVLRNTVWDVHILLLTIAGC